MITTEEIKKVEKLQKIDRKIKGLKEDYRHVISHSVCYYDGWRDGVLFNNTYNKELARIINHKILKLKRKRKELLEGKMC